MDAKNTTSKLAATKRRMTSLLRLPRRHPFPPCRDQPRHEVHRVALLAGHVGERLVVADLLAKLGDARTRQALLLRPGEMLPRDGERFARPLQSQKQVDE